MRIACPRCAWEPPPSARWFCTCGHRWHTFDTAGQCPKCRHVWRDTQCLACQKWSPHHDWYHDLPPVDALVEGVGAPAGGEPAVRLSPPLVASDRAAPGSAEYPTEI